MNYWSNLNNAFPDRYPQQTMSERIWYLLTNDEEFNIGCDVGYEAIEEKFASPPSCLGCKNYHGTIYGDSKLICAIHPYGWEKGDVCPDWEA